MWNIGLYTIEREKKAIQNVFSDSLKDLYKKYNEYIKITIP